MKTHVDHADKQQRQTVAQAVSQQKGIDASTYHPMAIGFVDNRPETIKQQELQAKANNSSRVRETARWQRVADTRIGRDGTSSIQKKEIGSTDSTRPIQRLIDPIDGLDAIDPDLPEMIEDYNEAGNANESLLMLLSLERAIDRAWGDHGANPGLQALRTQIGEELRLLPPGMGIYHRNGGERIPLNVRQSLPLIWAEEHNTEKFRIFNAIRVYPIIEGRTERSLSGVRDDAIPQAQATQADPDAAIKHRKFDPDQGLGMAVENYWVRNASHLHQLWGNFGAWLQEMPNRITPGLDFLNNAQLLAETLEFINTLRQMEVDATQESGTYFFIRSAKTFVDNAAYYDILRRTLTFGGRAIALFGELERRYGREVLRNCGWNFDFVFKPAIFQLANYHASEGASTLPVYLKEGNWEAGTHSVLDVWSPQREVFMLKNINEAFERRGGRGMIATIGAAHYRHQRANFDALARNYGGRVFDGSVADFIHEFRVPIPEE